VVRTSGRGFRVGGVAGIVAGALVLIAVLGIAGTGLVPFPTPSGGSFALPSASSAPVEVIQAYLEALQAGDCDSVRMLTSPVSDMVDVCGLTDVTGFSVTNGPIAVDPDRVRFSATLNITGTRTGIPAGEITWIYFLQRDSGGAWRIAGGGGHLPPSMEWPTLQPS
jgi:hypothetical protein